MQVLTKQPAEAVTFTFDFASVIATGGMVASITSIAIANCGAVSSSANATLSNNAMSGRQAQTRVTGGTHGESYKLTCLVVDSTGQTHELDGLVEVIEL